VGEHDARLTRNRARGGSHIGAFEDDARRPAVAHLIGEFLPAYLLHDTDAEARLPQDASVPDVLELRAAN
jgi:hypothetical protein